MTEDRALSPHTGWTRAHWERLAGELLAAVRPFATPGHALVRLPGPASRSGEWSDGLEGFARTFLLAGFSGDTEWHAEGLAAGSDPASPERWPRVDEIPQARVEAASIALALHESGLWAQLDARVQEQLVEWLGGMRRVDVPANNWVWFRAVVSAFLRSVGADWAPEDLEEATALTDEWYVGDGWYTDGAGRNFDHYCGWAMHFYPLWISRIAGEPPEPRYVERLRRFLEDAQHLVATDGAPLLQGRSLTYRWAMLAPFWTGAVFDASPLSPGRTRRLASGVLRHFVDAGSIDARGLLPLGWHHAFPALRQSYSGPGSPYWAAKGFAGLVLRPDHPVWTATEEPLELEEHDVERTLRAPGWLVSGTTSDGIVRIANHGTAREPVAWLSGEHAAAPMADALYSLPAYSTHAAPVGKPDRGNFETLELGPRRATSQADGVVTTSLLHGPWEVRLVHVREARRLRISGHALAGAVEGGRIVRDGLVSAVTPLRGFTASGVETLHGADPFGDPSHVPYVEVQARPGELYAALVTLTRGDAPTDVRLEAGAVVFGDSERVELGPELFRDLDPGVPQGLLDPLGRGNADDGGVDQLALQGEL